MTIFLTALVVAATLFYITLPLRAASQKTPAASIKISPPQDEHTALLARRDSLLREIKELEFEHHLGRVDDADFTAWRAESSRQAAQILQRLELFSSRAESPNFATEQARRYELEIEAEIFIARWRQHENLLPESSRNGSPKYVPPASTLSVNNAAADGWKCAQCDRAMQQADRFCADCGTPRPKNP